MRVADDDHHTDPVRAQQVAPEVVAEVEAVEAGGEDERPCEVDLRISHRNHPHVGRLTHGPDPVDRSLGGDGDVSVRGKTLGCLTREPEEIYRRT
jgi:hypothetical protein